jgi:hypothetical protein
MAQRKIFHITIARSPDGTYSQATLGLPFLNFDKQIAMSIPSSSINSDVSGREVIGIIF